MVHRECFAKPCSQSHIYWRKWIQRATNGLFCSYELRRAAMSHHLMLKIIFVRRYALLKSRSRQLLRMLIKLAFWPFSHKCDKMFAGNIWRLKHLYAVHRTCSRPWLLSNLIYAHQNDSVKMGFFTLFWYTLAQEWHNFEKSYLHK